MSHIDHDTRRVGIGAPKRVIVTDYRSAAGERGVAIEVDELMVALFLTPTQARQTARKLFREADKADGQVTRVDYLLGEQNRKRVVGAEAS
jgi:hypothetical protein